MLDMSKTLIRHNGHVEQQAGGAVASGGLPDAFRGVRVALFVVITAVRLTVGCLDSLEFGSIIDAVITLDPKPPKPKLGNVLED